MSDRHIDWSNLLCGVLKADREGNGHLVFSSNPGPIYDAIGQAREGVRIIATRDRSGPWIWWWPNPTEMDKQLADQAGLVVRFNTGQ